VALARALSKLHRATAPQEGLLSVLYTHDEPRERDRRWLSTHPPIEDRIDRLVERGDHAGQRHHIGRIRP
jgi:heat shock protein HtpX